MTKPEFYQEAAAQIRALMATEGTGWVKPWANASAYMNGVSGHQYRGFNTLLLMMASSARGYTDPRFVGFKQACAIAGDGPGLKGQTGIRILAPMIGKREDKAGNVTTAMFGAKPMTLFNVEQVAGADLSKLVPTIDLSAIEPVAQHAAADAVIAGTGARIRHGGDQACYSPSNDTITMPPREAWVGTTTTSGRDAYYSTVFHELGHWTGHTSRLNRLKMCARFGQEYAFEELVAEITAVFACRITGVTMEPTPDNARYLNGWMERLTKEDGLDFFMRAASQAQKACDLIVAQKIQEEQAA
jgi:antirestriction protein ArdC